MASEEWPHNYHSYLKNQAGALIKELNYSVLQIYEKYSESSIRKSDIVGLNGIGIGLIIGMSNLINESLQFLRKKHKLKFPFRLGPQVGNAHWCDLIVAGSNWIRHSDEWRSSTYDYLKSGDSFWRLLTLSNISSKEDFLKHFDPRYSKSNLDIILEAKIPLNSFILAGNNYWTMAELLRLNDSDYSNDMFVLFLKQVAKVISEKIE